jgi:hypothetical protein
MAERRYTVAEIDRMRSALRLIIIRPNTNYYPDEMERKIEDQLRTYMLNGTDPEELDRLRDEQLRRDQTMGFHQNR